MAIMRRSRQLYYRVLLMAAVVFSLCYNFAVSWMQTSPRDHQTVSLNRTNNMVITSSQVSAASSRLAAPIRLLWGIQSGASEQEKKRRQVIRSTYLGSNASWTTCSLADFVSQEKKNASCELVYSFLVWSGAGQLNDSTLSSENDVLALPAAAAATAVASPSRTEEASEWLRMVLSWFQYAAHNVLDHRFEITHVFLVDSGTLVDPTFIIKKQYSLETLHPLLQSQHRHVYAQTPNVSSKDCQSQSRLPDKKACQKLMGRLTVVSRDVASNLAECSQVKQVAAAAAAVDNNNNDNNNNNNSIQDIIRLCSPSTQILEFPRQHGRSNPDAYQLLWRKLVEWNRFQQVQVLNISYVTAKFGRDSKYAKSVGRTRIALLSQGWHPQQIHAYHTFPDYILHHHDDDEGSSPWKLHLEFLNNHDKTPKGGGYWFWKAPLLLHHLDQLATGDFLIYADIDLRDHLRWTLKLLETMVQEKQSLALYRVDFPERLYDKRDVYQHYCPARNQSADLSLQYAGGWLVLRKTTGIQQFLQAWNDGMANYHFVNDDPSRLPNIPEFQYHLNDQSILSLLIKCRFGGHAPTVFTGADTLKDWEVHMFDI